MVISVLAGSHKILYKVRLKSFHSPFRTKKIGQIGNSLTDRLYAVSLQFLNGRPYCILQCIKVGRKKQCPVDDGPVGKLPHRIAADLETAYHDIIASGLHGIKAKRSQAFCEGGKIPVKDLGSLCPTGYDRNHDIAFIGIDTSAAAFASDHLDSMFPAILDIDLCLKVLITSYYNRRRRLPHKKSLFISTTCDLFFKSQIVRKAFLYIVLQDDILHGIRLNSPKFRKNVDMFGIIYAFSPENFKTMEKNISPKKPSLSLRSIFRSMMEDGYYPTFEKTHIQFGLEDNIAVVEYEERVVSVRLFFSIEEDAYELFLEASNMTMIETFAVKPAILDDMQNIMFSCEMLCDNLREFRKFLPWATDRLKEALTVHKDEMKKLLLANEVAATTIPATDDFATGRGRKLLS